MNKCKCWEEKQQIKGWYGDKPIYKTVQICIGTKECEECSCGGDESKCNFYPEKKKENKCNYFSKGFCGSNYITEKKCSCNGDKGKCDFYESFRKENKIMTTAEMWLKAQEDGKTYKAYDMMYNRQFGFHDKDKKKWPGNAFEYVNDIFEIKNWELKPDNEMTRAEAEKKFGIKIID